jgi:putative hemolysin
MTPPLLALPFLRLAERVCGLTALRQLYDRRRSGDFIAEALRLLDIAVQCEGEFDAIPTRGPLVVIANHPSGALDGLALAHLLRKRRDDAKLLANHLLGSIPELREHIIAIEVFGRGVGSNTRALRDARRWLAQGGALIVFPSGEVSSVRQADGGVVDREWQRGFLKLVDWTGAAVVPAFIHTQNSRIFRLAVRIHAWLRTAMLGRELLAQRGTALRVSIGSAITPARLRQLPNDAARLAYLRARTYALEHRRERPCESQPTTSVPPEAADDLAGEIASLPARARLLTSGQYEVYCSTASRMPAVVREIGRLREVTFRLVGEGTGRVRDLDRFDETYMHLFVWDREACCVVGAYRLGLTDRLDAASDPHALYTRSLFQFGVPLLRQLGPAIELGRSFVRVEYQRESNALLLLWRGIGAFVAREPRYRFLFGAVSISARYQSLTRQLLARFLSGDRFLSDLAALVRPSRPLPVERDAAALVQSRVVADLEDVEQLVSEVEGRGLPVLLRQYLKLNARLLGFSVDPEFGDVLDGLVVVDLLGVKPALLQRYLGREHAATLLEFHRQRTHTAAPSPSPLAAVSTS